LFFGFEKNVSKSDIPALKALSLLLADKIVFNIREKQGLAYGMNAGVDVKNNIAMFYIKMATRPANVNKLIPQFPNFFKKTFSNSITKDNLTRVVNMYLGRMMFRRLSSINQAYYLGDSYYFFNNINQDSDFFNKLKHVKLNDVKKAAKKYLGAKNYIELIVR